MSPANREALRPSGKPLQKESAMSAEKKAEKCHILLVLEKPEVKKSLHEALQRLGINLNISECTPHDPRALLRALDELRPDVILMDFLKGGGNPVHLAEKAYEREVSRLSVRKAMPKFSSLFGKVVRVIGPNESRNDMGWGYETFMWKEGYEEGSCPDEADVIKLLMLSDSAQAMLKLAQGVRPALNHRLRSDLIVLALQAESHSEAKDHALSFLRDSGVKDVGVAERLAKAVRWLNIVWTEHRDIFEDIAFPRHRRDRSIPLHNAVCFSDVKAVAEMLAEVDEFYASSGSPKHSPLLYLAAADIPRFADKKEGADAKEFKILRMLLEKGMDPNTRWTGWHNTPAIVEAAQEGLVHSVSMLLEYGAEVNVFDDEGNTPMHVAAAGGHVEVIRVLAKAGGAWLETRNKEGLTPIALAKRLEDKSAALLLAKLGAKG